MTGATAFEHSRSPATSEPVWRVGGRDAIRLTQWLAQTVPSLSQSIA
jgi:hypothetical protein